MTPIKQLPPEEIARLKRKAYELRETVRPLYDQGETSKALEASSEATRIEAWITVQEGGNDILKQCIENQRNKPAKVSLTRTNEIRVREYKLKGMPHRHNTQGLQAMYAKGTYTKPTRPGFKEVPAKLNFG